MAKRLLILCSLWLSASLSFAQEVVRPAINIELLVQELLAQQEDETLDYEAIYENLLQYYQNPINLNATTPEELTSLLFLSPVQIQNLVNYIKANGKLLSIYELQAVPGFDLPTIYKILPFVTVSAGNLLEDRGALWDRIITSENNWFILRYDRVLETRKGYTTPDSIGNRLATRYTGSPDKLLMRYRNSHAHDYSLGFTLEKDAGEQFIWQPKTHRYGPDFYSAHLQLYNKGNFKALALGDYQLQFGQGLLLSSGFSVGKGSETITTIRRSNVGIRPFSSALESGYFRGAAATYLLPGNLELTGFYSAKNIDASLSDRQVDSVTESSSFSGVQLSGLHRTPTEIANKHRVGEQTLGSNITYKSREQNFVAGVMVLQTCYNTRLQRREQAYTTFDFSGTRNINLGIHYSYNWQNISFFGEAAHSSGGGLGTVNGVLASLTRNLDVSVVYRNYARNFFTFYGNAFGENTRNHNEKGLYLGLKLKPAAKWELTAYYDQFRFPWLKYRVDAPSHGTEYLTRLLYRPTKTVLLYAQARGESKGLNYTGPDRKIPEVIPATRRSYLFYLDYSPAATINLRSRVQGSQYRHGGSQETGYYIGQELSSSFKRSTLSFRVALFDTDDFDTRQYVMERDVLYAFSVPVLSGAGSRMYLVWQQNISPKFDFWVKLSQTHYQHQKTISSGLEEINGPNRSEIRMQVRYRL